MPATLVEHQLHMPRLRRFRIDRMSIYSKKPTVDVSFASGVFCLAGANGLGKSTFLAALNYAITGIVPDPERKFESVPEYYAFSKDFADNYFDGRVKDADRAGAALRYTNLIEAASPGSRKRQ